MQMAPAGSLLCVFQYKILLVSTANKSAKKAHLRTYAWIEAPKVSQAVGPL